MKQKKVQLRDIAERVGVSTATVSYVLNNRPMANRISREVADKIRATAKELNYHPNQIAKSLKMQRTHTLGLIVADIANPFWAQISRIIEDAAKRMGYTVIFGSSDEDPGKAQDLIYTLLNRQVDGLIVAAVEGSEAQLRAVAQKGIPLVLIDRYFPDELFQYVAIDNYSAAFDAVQLMIDRGRKRVGIVAFQTELMHLQERNRGYFEAMDRAGLPVQQHWIARVDLNNIKEGTAAAVEKMLRTDPPAEAIFFTTNLLALHGLHYLKEQGVEIPAQVAVSAFDEADFYSFFPVSITHIRQPLDTLGQKAVEALLLQIENKNEPAIRANYPATLVQGKSSG